MDVIKMKQKIICLGIIGMLLLISVASFSTVAKVQLELETPYEPEKPDNPEEPAPDGRIIILGGRGLRVIAIGLDPDIGDYIRIEYELNRLGHQVDTYKEVDTYNRILNFQLDRGTYTVTAYIDGISETKSGIFFLCFFL